MLVKPYLTAFIGCTGDYITTQIGLANGYVEQNIHYSPVYTVGLFFSLITVLQLTLPKTKVWATLINLFALMSWAGMVHNIFVLAGVI